MRGLLLAALLAATPAQAGTVLALSCADGGFETRVMEGQGFAEAALGLERTPLWCPAEGKVETAWVPGTGEVARELSRLAASDAPDDTPVTIGRPDAVERLKLGTVGQLRRRLALPAGEDLRYGGATCQPLRRYYDTTAFPPCNGARLERQVVPRVWD